jgi:hypothetical protein
MPAGSLGRGKCPCNLKETPQRRNLRCRACDPVAGLRREIAGLGPIRVAVAGMAEAMLKASTGQVLPGATRSHSCNRR